MPELPPTILNERRNSKSDTSPSRQTRKVLPLVGFSAVVWPVMVPSFADQNFGLPSQPVRSTPLNRLLNPDSSSAASAPGRGAMKTAPTIKTVNRDFRAFISDKV